MSGCFQADGDGAPLTNPHGPRRDGPAPFLRFPVTTPRKHHYVPQCYLSGFTIEPGSSRLHVLDKESGRSYPSRIGDAGCERDFYIIELEDDGDPFASRSSSPPSRPGARKQFGI